MDPEATLEEIRELVARVDDGDTDVAADHDRLVDLVAALDQWLKRGGALPPSWTAYREVDHGTR